MREIIVHKGLKPKYWLRSLWWKIVVRSVFLLYADIWKEHAIVHYPLTIDIELGSMRLYYLKYGFHHVCERITTYNKLLADRIAGKEEEDLSPKFFQRAVKLTNPVSIEKQLEMEMQDLKYY